MTKPAQAWFLVGPTAAGKTDIAHDLARTRGAWILSADSMTVYRGLDLGTAKPTAAQRAEVRYFGLDLRDPDQPFSVADFLEAARIAFAEAESAGRPMIVVGGSGLYVRCLLEGLRPGAPADAGIRSEADALLARGGLAALQDRVRAQAPAHFAALADVENPRRLIRAWEQATAGQPVEDTWQGPRPRLAGVRYSREELHRRIERRVAALFAAGLVEETRALRARFPVWSDTAAQAIGYAEALTHLENGVTVQQAMDRTAQRTRQLARRQLTWFRHQAEVEWVEASPHMPLAAQVQAVGQAWERHGITTLRF